MLIKTLLHCMAIILTTEAIQMTKELKQEVENELQKGTKITDEIAKFQDDRIFEVVHRMSNFLGSIAVFSDFLRTYDPTSESTDLKRMVKLIVAANDKLQNERSRYHTRMLRPFFFEIRYIDFSFMLLNKFIGRIELLSCNSQSTCQKELLETLQLFESDFDTTRYINNVINAVLVGKVDKNSTESPCNIRDIAKPMKETLILAYEAEFIVVVQKILREKRFDFLKHIKTWDDSMYKLRRKMFNLMALCFEKTKCEDSCGTGECVKWQRLDRKTCLCPTFIEGPKCNIHNGIKAAHDVWSLIDAAANIQKTEDIAALIKRYIFPGKCFHDLVETINNLIHTSETQNQLASTNSADLNSITFDLQYYMYELKEYISCDETTSLSEYTQENLKLLSRLFAKLLYRLHGIMTGKSKFVIYSPKQIMISFINSQYRSAVGCSAEYKNTIDTVWKGIQTIQLRAYIAWMQTQYALLKSNKHITELYKNRLQVQESLMNETTCSIDIKHSANANCANGYYLTPDQTLELKCIAGYFRRGIRFISCNNTSSCIKCNCDTTGSDSVNCTSETGRCQCKTNYYGPKCSERDCIWNSWTPWTNCSKPCDYGGFQTRTRLFKTEARGSGKLCTGPAKMERSCFQRCCNNQFYCSNKNKCIPKQNHCDYYNHCGDNQDETTGCSEKCYMRYTPFTKDGNGDIIFLDRQTVSCQSSEYAIRQFHLVRSQSHNQIGYQYTCCKMNKKICFSQRRSNPLTPDGGRDIHYLDRQDVSCPSNGFLSMFHLTRAGSSSHVRYDYTCCSPKYGYKLSCYDTSTTPNEDGNGGTVFLDRHNVNCGERYFISRFHLTRPSQTTISYRYRCCRVIRFIQ